MKKRIHIITGHYGVGKSEVSVNLAIKLSQQNENVVFADMDIVNPYFRSNEAKSVLEDSGIKVITTMYANTNVDVPALTGELSKYLVDKSCKMVIDVGGDNAGSLVIGRYRHEIKDEEASVYLVINCFRPETTTVSGALNILEEIHAASRMKVNYIINNSHLMDDTTCEDILKGMDFAAAVSKETNIPIAFHAIMKNEQLKFNHNVDEPILWLNKTMGLNSHLKFME